MTVRTASILRTAAELIRSWGHNPHDPIGSPLNGHSLTSAIAKSAKFLAGDRAPSRAATAAAYVLDVLGRDPAGLTAATVHREIFTAGLRMRGRRSAAWAAAVLDQAADVAAASSWRAPTPPPLPVIQPPARIHRRPRPRRQAV